MNRQTDEEKDQNYKLMQKFGWHDDLLGGLVIYLLGSVLFVYRGGEEVAV